MKPMHIMTVDDDPLMLDLLATYFFRCQQSRTYQALDAETALKELNRKPYDVVLTDINRPGMDGPDLHPMGLPPWRPAGDRPHRLLPPPLPQAGIRQRRHGLPGQTRQAAPSCRSY